MRSVIFSPIYGKWRQDHDLSLECPFLVRVQDGALGSQLPLQIFIASEVEDQAFLSVSSAEVEVCYKLGGRSEEGEVTSASRYFN